MPAASVVHVPVQLSKWQRQLYRHILLRNYPLLTRPDADPLLLLSKYTWTHTHFIR